MRLLPFSGAVTGLQVIATVPEPGTLPAALLAGAALLL
jgi:hypothetical protein